jgi:hypothetical protein
MRATLRTLSGRLRGIVVLVLAGCLLFSAVAPAFAALGDDPEAVSSSNPWDPENKDTYWRHGWGNSLTPDITFTQVPFDTGWVTPGFIYRVDRLIDSSPTTGTGDPYTHLSMDPTGPSQSHTLDMRGVLASAPVGEWGYVWPAGQSVAVEGDWYFHVRFFNERRVQSGTTTYRLAIDVTSPAPVENFHSDIASTTITTTTRRVYTWIDKEYDALSGVGLYEVLVNGRHKGYVPSIPWNSIPVEFTVEDLLPGESLVEVRAIDRAGNFSAKVGEMARVDTDTPSVTVIAPEKDEQQIGGSYWFKAAVADAGGIDKVVFKVDGSTVHTFTAPPYELLYDTRLLPDGGHQVQVFAWDRSGQFGTQTRYFKVKNTLTAKVEAPSLGQVVHGTYTFRGSADPTPNITAMEYRIDDVWKRTVYAAPWTFPYDTKQLSNGEHTVTVTAHASDGQTAVSKSKFKVDNSVLTISNISDYPDPFYPRLKDGYKDGMTVTYKLSRPSPKVVLRIWSGTKLVREIVSVSRPTGYNKIYWDGKLADKSVRAGTYSYQIVAQDQYGSQVATSRTRYTTTIRFYEVVYVARNKYKIVQR